MPARPPLARPAGHGGKSHGTADSCIQRRRPGRAHTAHHGGGRGHRDRGGRGGGLQIFRDVVAAAGDAYRADGAPLSICLVWRLAMTGTLPRKRSYGRSWAASSVTSRKLTSWPHSRST